MKYQAIAANSKIYFGQDIPNMFVEGTNSPPKSAPSPNLPSAEPDIRKGKPDRQWVRSPASAQDRLMRTCFVCGAENTELKVMGGMAFAAILVNSTLQS